MTPSSVLNHSYGFRRNPFASSSPPSASRGEAGLWLGAPQRAFLSEGEWTPGCYTGPDYGSTCEPVYTCPECASPPETQYNCGPPIDP
jgi:hypothetical protein